MSVESSVKAALAANAPLIALMTGGVVAFGATGRNGISKVSVPTAYDLDGFLKPTVMVRDRSETPWGGIHDVGARTKSFRDVIEIYLYDDGDRSYDTVDSAANAVASVLDERFITGAGWLKQVNRILNARDVDMNNALFQRLDFSVVHVRRL